MAKIEGPHQGRIYHDDLILIGAIALNVVVANALKKTREIEFGSLARIWTQRRRLFATKPW
jgi:hypothetical protein